MLPRLATAVPSAHLRVEIPQEVQDHPKPDSVVCLAVAALLPATSRYQPICAKAGQADVATDLLPRKSGPLGRLPAAPPDFCFRQDAAASQGITATQTRFPHVT
jgi:hypothetical protein